MRRIRDAFGVYDGRIEDEGGTAALTGQQLLPDITAEHWAVNIREFIVRANHLDKLVGAPI
jgi:hypothetical protein